MNHDDDDDVGGGGGSNAHSVAYVETWKLSSSPSKMTFHVGVRAAGRGRIQKREAEGCWYYGTGKP
jgi:hypothetical protein